MTLPTERLALDVDSFVASYSSPYSCSCSCSDDRNSSSSIITHTHARTLSILFFFLTRLKSSFYTTFIYSSILFYSVIFSSVLFNSALPACPALSSASLVYFIQCSALHTMRRYAMPCDNPN